MGNGGNDGTVLVGTLRLELGTLEANVNDANRLLNSIGKNSKGQIKQYTQTLTTMTEAISNMSKAMAEAEQASKRTGSGKILSDVTSAYRELKMVHAEYMNAMKSGNADQQSYWQGRKSAAEDMIASLKAQASTVEKTDKNFQAIEDTIKRMGNEIDGFSKKLEQNKMAKFAKDSASYLKQTKAAFSDLTTAQTQYSKAVKAGDEASARYWSERLDASKLELANIEGAIPSLKLDEATRTKILDIIYKSKAAQQGLNEEVKKGPTAVEGMAKGWDKVYNTIRLITGLSLVKVFKDALD